MTKHFAALQQLAASNAYLCTGNAASEEEQTFQWYVSNIDSFIVSVDIEKLRETFSQLNVSEDSKQKLHDWLNKFTIIWNRWRGDIHIGFAEVYRLATEKERDIEKFFDYAIDILRELKEKPEDESLKSDFESYVKSLDRKLDPIRDELKSLLDNLVKFLDSFEQQQKIFTQICAQACKEQDIKEEHIKDIENIIRGYQDHIDKLKKSIIALGVIDGIGVLATIGALIGAFFTGGLTLTLLVPFLPIIGCTSYMIGKFRQEIAQLNDKIKKKMEEMGGLKDDIIGLITFSNTIKGISEKDSTIKEYVRKAKKPWDALSEDLNKILADISIISNATSSIYDEYLVSFENAKVLWTDTFMPEILKLKPEPIKVVTTSDGFSIENPESWEEAIEKYSVSIDEYFSKNIA